jgi:hypothetical protein
MLRPIAVEPWHHPRNWEPIHCVGTWRGGVSLILIHLHRMDHNRMDHNRAGSHSDWTGGPVAIKVERISAWLPAIRFGTSAAPAARAPFAPLLTLWFPLGLEDGPIFFSHPPTSYFFNTSFQRLF